MAIDETLARPVTVLTFARGFPRIADVVTAARAASRLTDARLAQVFDVEEDWDHAYVVMEWVAGDSLEDLLADGPLDPGQGAEIVAQGAEALAVAHAAGVAHLCLNPDSVRWTSGGGVKIVGLGIDAALAGVTADDPALADTLGLGKLLYAALTAHWPGGDWPSLPPAPEVDGHPCSPRQVRAGVPTGIDDVACQILVRHTADGNPSVTTPAMLATALNRVIPAPARPLPVSGHGGYATGTGPATLAPGSPYADYAASPRRAGSGRVLGAIVGIVVLGVLGAGVWAFSHHSPRSLPPVRPTHSASPSAAPASVLEPRSATAFGPFGGDNASQADLAIDSQPGTSWSTDSYRGSPRFGNLYDGTGLMLDMGKRVDVSSVTVTFGNVPGTHVRIEVGNSADGTGSGPPAGFTTLGRSASAAGPVTFTGHGTTSGEFVLIWFTKLAPQADQFGHYQADVFNVVVRGSS
ncbi:MAG: protein kinase family protein [Actinobacteria bacterium]|nr:protein kinase family protein [Actinomycetota bacterium]